MKSSLSRHEARYLDRFPRLDPGVVGAKLGMGAQHVVREYGKDQVIKYPRLETLRDVISQTVGRVLTPTASHLQADVDLARENFGDHVLPTEIVTDVRGKSYCMLQPRMNQFDALDPDMLQADPVSEEELRYIVEVTNDVYARHGKFLDLMGWNPGKIWKGGGYLDNVVRTPGRPKKLQLPDVSFFPKPDYSLLGAYFQRLLEFQRSNMRKFKLRFAE